VEEIRVSGRATQGVRLLNLDEKDELVDLARVMADNGEEADLEADNGEEADPEAGDAGPAEGREAVAGTGREGAG
jgi:hypothetical protein